MKDHIPLKIFFLTFDMHQLGNLVSTTGKGALILVYLPSLKVIRVESSEDIASQSCKNLPTFVLGGGGWGANLFPHHINVSKISRL